MKTVLVTGSCGLLGSSVVKAFQREGYHVVGVDNDMRKYYFGESTAQNRPSGSYTHRECDIRDNLEFLFQQFKFDAVVHAAAQPSHDWSAKEPMTDFTVNAVATLQLLQLALKHCQKAPFVYVSTSKVYGDRVNSLPYCETATRVVPPDYYRNGVDESMSVDFCAHSLFGVSKLSADLLVQEFGRRFNMPTVCFRPGCITGAAHAGAELHGFLSYLAKCVASGTEYKVIGYGGKQVRDNVHADDLADAFALFCERPTCGEVYNIGGGFDNSCSVLEALEACGRLLGKTPKYVLVGTPRYGDHKWWVSDSRKFRADYGWSVKRDLESIYKELCGL